jgi:WD40 repeat protein
VCSARLQNLNKYKLLSSYSEPSSHALTTFACINSFLSTLVLLADSGRNLHWFDAAVSRVVRTVPDAHAKSIHCIVMNSTSPFGGHTAAEVGETNLDMQQLFVTAATDSSIKLWDVRAKESIDSHRA